jgi:hypothetical protein
MIKLVLLDVARFTNSVISPSQLQEALKESTNIDAEHDEVTWVELKRCYLWVRPSQLQEALKESTKVNAEHDKVTWVELNRTPVGLHPNCKRRLKKVPRLTQNTICPHELRV